MLFSWPSTWPQTWKVYEWHLRQLVERFSYQLSFSDDTLELIFLVLWQMLNKMCKLEVCIEIIFCRQGLAFGNVKLESGWWKVLLSHQVQLFRFLIRWRGPKSCLTVSLIGILHHKGIGFKVGEDVLHSFVWDAIFFFICPLADQWNCGSCLPQGLYGRYR